MPLGSCCLKLTECVVHSVFCLLRFPCGQVRKLCLKLLENEPEVTNQCTVPIGFEKLLENGHSQSLAILLYVGAIGLDIVGCFRRNNELSLPCVIMKVGLGIL